MLIAETEVDVVRKEPLSRIPDELLESVEALLKAYADRRNPPPTANDIAARLGEDADVIRRACRKLEIRGLLVVNPAAEAEERTYSLPVEEDSGPIPEELLYSVLGLVRSYEERANPAPTVKDISAGLGVEERDARWACTTLEKDGLLRQVPTAYDKYPGYVSVGDHPAPTTGALEADREKITAAVVRSTSRVLRNEHAIEIRPSISETRRDERTTEDWSFFLRVSGDIEGSVFFGIDRPALRGLLSAMHGKSVDDIEIDGLTTIAGLVTRIGREINQEISSLGYEVDVVSSSSAQPSGMRVTSHGWPQAAICLLSEPGPITAHIALYEPPEEDTEDSPADSEDTSDTD